MMDWESLKLKLQGPRRAHDTFYGRNIMRKLSIYITWALSHFSISPSLVTFISILFGLLGAYLMGVGLWTSGLLLVNGWYLLDHVDGELARFQNNQTATGFYFDTMSNAFVPPAALLGVGIGLSKLAGFVWVYMGLLAAYGFLMLMVISLCEYVVREEFFKKKSRIEPSSPAQAITTGGSRKAILKKVFEKIHFLVTFPSFLLVMTLVIVGFLLIDKNWLEAALRALIVIYAISVTFVWVSIFSHKIIYGKIDA